MYVAFFLEVGLLLLVLPWSAFWERNYFADLSPGIYDLITNNFVRGAISGLGVVNLFAGLADLARMFVQGTKGPRVQGSEGPRVLL